MGNTNSELKKKEAEINKLSNEYTHYLMRLEIYKNHKILLLELLKDPEIIKAINNIKI